MLPPIYPPEAVQPMRDELIQVGFRELKTPEDVDGALQGSPGTVLCVINSVCGCAAGSARPGVALALQHSVIPDALVTAFAGMEREAVEHVRQLHAAAAPPSSPSIVLFAGGKTAAIIERRHIEGRTPDQVAQLLVEVFDRFCSRPGPSIPRDQFVKLRHAQMCGSSIPRLN